MGSVIAKFAFLPPDRNIEKAALSRHPNVGYVTTTEGEKICYIKCPAPPQGRDPNGHVVLFSHGNAESLGTSYKAYEQMAQILGVDLFAFDPPGYGLSSGDTPSEAGYVRAGDAMLQHLLIKEKVPRSNIILMGRSLGTGVATDVAYRNPGMGALILIAPLKSAANVAGKAAGALLYLNDIMCNIRKIGSIDSYPICIFHGDKDEVVPYEHGVALHEEARGKNKHAYFHTMKGAGHNDIEMRCGREFFGEMRNFIAQAPTFRAALKQAAAAAASAKEDDSTSFSSFSSSSKRGE